MLKALRVVSEEVFQADPGRAAFPPQGLELHGVASRQREEHVLVLEQDPP
jgi:hypothetical protein